MLKTKPNHTTGAGVWTTLLATVLPATFLMQLDKQAMVILAPSIRQEFGFDLVTMAQILGATAWSYALAQIPGAWLAERIGPFKTLGLACVLWSVVVFISPLSSVVWMFFICRLVMGCLQAPDWTSSMIIVRRTVPTLLRSRANSALLGALYLGAFSGGPLTVAIASHFGWRAVFFAYGTIGFAFGAMVLAKFRNRPCVQSNDGDLETSPPPLAAVIGQLARSAQVHSMAITYCCFSGIQSFFYVLFPLYLVEARHLSMSQMGWLASAPIIALYLSVLISGVASDAILKRTKSIWLARVPSTLVALIGSSACFAAAIWSPDLTVMMALMCVGMALVGLGQIALWSSVQDLSSSGNGMITAWTQTLGGLSFGAIPIATAVLVHRSGTWHTFPYLLTAMGVCGAAAFCFVRPQRPLPEVVGATITVATA